MTRNKRSTACLVFTLIGALSFADPYGIITCAEGSSFVRIRDGKSKTFRIQDQDVSGMEIVPGDIYQTLPDSFLELAIYPVGASVMIAENTSFLCKTDSPGNSASGILYYGRVRARVAKLAGTASYGISSPELAASVRGTDFGLDVISLRSGTEEDVGNGAAASGAAGTLPAPGAIGISGSRVLYRVFCLDGSVLVSEVSGSPLDALLVGKDEMVELVSDSASPAGAARPLRKKPVSAEVSGFWLPRPFSGVEPHLIAIDVPVSNTGGNRTITRRVWPSGSGVPVPAQNVGIVRMMAVAFMCAGTVTCLGASAWSAAVDRDDWVVEPAYSAGCIMISSGSVLAILSLFAD